VVIILQFLLRRVSGHISDFAGDAFNWPKGSSDWVRSLSARLGISKCPQLSGARRAVVIRQYPVNTQGGY